MSCLLLIRVLNYGRKLQTDGEYKITTLLIYLFQTIESETISNSCIAQARIRSKFQHRVGQQV